MAIIDVFTFNGEYDLLEIHLNVLNDVVDQFVIVEAPTTFSGKPKPLYYEQGKDRYKQFHHKIKYFVIDENYSPEEIALAESSPNTQGAAHWKHEFLQKESIKKALTHLNDDDIVFVGDCDEIWNPEFTNFPTERKVYGIHQHMYAYHLDKRSNETWFGTKVTRYGNLKDRCLNHLRTEPVSVFPDVEGMFPERIHRENIFSPTGWHFSSMGGVEELKRKLGDSYTEETYYSPEIQANLQVRFDKDIDFLGRGFSFTIDESEWPQYLKDNKEKYKHLCKSQS